MLKTAQPKIINWTQTNSVILLIFYSFQLKESAVWGLFRSYIQFIFAPLIKFIVTRKKCEKLQIRITLARQHLRSRQWEGGADHLRPDLIKTATDKLKAFEESAWNVHDADESRA